MAMGRIDFGKQLPPVPQAYTGLGREMRHRHVPGGYDVDHDAPTLELPTVAAQRGYTQNLSALRRIGHTPPNGDTMSIDDITEGNMAAIKALREREISQRSVTTIEFMIAAIPLLILSVANSFGLTKKTTDDYLHILKGGE